LGIINLQHCSVPDLEEWSKEKELLNRLNQQQLLRAQQRTTNQADKNWSERSFCSWGHGLFEIAAMYAIHMLHLEAIRN
jgi:hypothetical protein